MGAEYGRTGDGKAGEFHAYMCGESLPRAHVRRVAVCECDDRHDTMGEAVEHQIVHAARPLEDAREAGREPGDDRLPRRVLGQTFVHDGLRRLDDGLVGGAGKETWCSLITQSIYGTLYTTTVHNMGSFSLTLLTLASLALSALALSLLAPASLPPAPPPPTLLPLAPLAPTTLAPLLSSTYRKVTDPSNDHAR